MDQIRTPLTISPLRSTSPPPMCVICLGTCKKMCFPDSCMHQFCFKCLLKWSRVKAECPLCSKTFRSIIHNIRSSSKYDKHEIPLETNPIVIDDVNTLENNEMGLHEMFMYISPQSTRVHYYQMMSAGQFLEPNENLRQTDTSGINFRREVYALGLWVNLPYRFRRTDVDARYFRDNPGARQRLVPWLNRELNVLLYENTQHVMYVVDVILQQLLVQHILSNSFALLLMDYLGPNTPHFIHEFYSFVRSPYDMIEYDRHIVWLNREPQSQVNVVTDYNEDSDVVVVTPQNEVIEINTDTDNSDVIIQEPPPPVIVDLVDSDENETQRLPTPNPSRRKPILPLKIRLKYKRKSRESSRRRQRSERLWSSSSSDEDDKSGIMRKRRRRVKGRKKRRRESADSSTSGSEWHVVRESSGEDTEDDVPLARLMKKEQRTKDQLPPEDESFKNYEFRRMEIGEPGPGSQLQLESGSSGERYNSNGAAGPSGLCGIGKEGERTVWYEKLMNWYGFDDC